MPCGETIFHRENRAIFVTGTAKETSLYLLFLFSYAFCVNKFLALHVYQTMLFCSQSLPAVRRAMLRIHTATSAAAVKKYFEASDYYSDGQEVIGHYGGELAARLGLSGRVDKASFDRLCDNINPLTGEPLTPRTNAFRRVGNDMVYSGPKSFGVVAMLAQPEERADLLGLLQETADRVQLMLQDDMKTRVRIGGAQTDRPTKSLLYATYLHTTARPVDGLPPDPHPHVHAFTFNATWDAVEERIKAGEFCDILRDRPFYEAAFFSLLAEGLEQRGFAIDRRANGKWEIAGLPQSLLDKFSKRTGEVEAEAARLGMTGEAEKAGLGAKTRSRKSKELTPDELRQAWLAQLTDDERDALARVHGKEIAADQPVTAKDAVGYALAHLSEKHSVFAERELMRVALLHGLGHITPEQVAAELADHGVIVEDINGRRMATTWALQEEERQLVSFAARGVGGVNGVGVADGLTETLPDGRTLTADQWAVAKGLLESTCVVDLFEGPAGAGKSFSLLKYDEGMRLAGQAVAYLATTSSAVKVLEQDGFDVNTVARFLVDEKMQAAARGGRLVIDEASMLGHKDAVKLFAIAGRDHLKLLFVGDERQHGSVARGSLLRVLKEHAGIRPHGLRQIMRQKDVEYRAAAQLLSDGKTLEGFAAIDNKGWVQEIGDDAARYQAIAADYVQTVSSGASCLVVSPTHAEAKSITSEIRNRLREVGKLDSDEREFTRLVAVDATEAQRGQASTYASDGLVIQFHQNAKGFAKGERLAVTDPASVPLHLADKFSLYCQETVRLAAGDKIRFTGTVKAFHSDHSYKNGDTLTVTEITRGNRLRLDDGRLVDTKGGQHLRPAFVETSFGAQGQTVSRVILGMAGISLPATNMEQLYVSASRGKDSMALYTDDKEAVKEAIVRSSQKLAALDVQAGPKLTPQQRLHRDYLERQRREALFSRRHVPGPLVPTPPQPERPMSYGR
jgi:conjugative relaxase-like TrwC/TraI family protein